MGRTLGLDELKNPREGQFVVRGASTCQADLRKTAISGLTASKLLFNAHVLEYGTLKKPFFFCQARKMRILQIRPTFPHRLRIAAASLRKVTQQPASDHGF